MNLLGFLWYFWGVYRKEKDEKYIFGSKNEQ
jgi:hypothetical protein